MIRSAQGHLKSTAITHAGMRGKNNEDRFSVSAFTSQGGDQPALLAIVSDGIGGHRAGEIAAEIAVETISDFIANHEPYDPVHLLRGAVSEASQAILNKAEGSDEYKGMGATVACCLILGERLYTVTVGDSRIYLLRAGDIQQLSIDHTWTQDAINQGLLSAEQAKNHPNAHVIRRYLGSKQPVVPDVRLNIKPGDSDEQAEANQGIPLLPGDQLLLCSDGLTDLVEDREILEQLGGQSVETALQNLVDLANARGGHDNITLVSLQMPSTKGTGQPVRDAKRPAWLMIALVLFALLLLLSVCLVVLVALIIVFSSRNGSAPNTLLLLSLLV